MVPHGKWCNIVSACSYCALAHHKRGVTPHVIPRRPCIHDTQELKRRILGIDPSQVSLFFPPDVPTSCRMLLSQLFVRDPKHRLGARKQDVPLIKARPLLLTTRDLLAV